MLCTQITNYTYRSIRSTHKLLNSVVFSIYEFTDNVTCTHLYAHLTKQKRSTEGCSKFKGPETRQVQERLVSTLEHNDPQIY